MGHPGLVVHFLGVSACTPEPGGNTASLALGRRIVVDAGWYLTDRLMRVGIDPFEVEAFFLTHCHHDHILGLPQLIYYWGRRADSRPARPLRVFGPKGEVERVVDDALCFLQFERYPELNFEIETKGLEPGAGLSVAGFEVATCPSIHSVPGLCYRFAGDGATVAVSGDTAFNPQLVELARGADLLVHEASHGPRSARELDRWAHSGSPDAAEVARQAGVKRLALVHCEARLRAEALEAAREIFAETFVPRDGEAVEVAAG